MFFKRLATVGVVLMLVVSMVACNSAPQSNITNGLNQSVSNQESHIYDTPTSSDQATDSSQQVNKGEDGQNSSANNSLKEESVTDGSSNTPSSNQNQDINDNKESEENNNNYSNVACNHDSNYTDPYQNLSKTEFYANYTPACCNTDAGYRSKHYLLSGSLEVPGQYVEEAANRPKSNGKFVRNTATLYTDDGNTYIVIDANGNETMRIHKAGGYITLEEVAAYMYAFGGGGKIPANYTTKKSTKPSSSPWGEYLRVNHSYFKGDTNKYPYEPELPNISGCGGNLRYYEMDIGTTGTSTPGYAPKPYIQGSKITRGAARIVYARQDLNGNGDYENNEIYVFYTHNHYNDFREYLNYYGGWGEMFGNVTGGGEYSSETNANPTPYVETAYDNFLE